MTLILTVANSSGVYQSSDYQLTALANSQFVSDRAGSKQLTATFKQFKLQLAFTGLAILPGSGLRTIDWLAQEVGSIAADSNLQSICEALKNKSTQILLSGTSRYGLEIVITAAAIGKRFQIAVISISIGAPVNQKFWTCSRSASQRLTRPSA